MILTTNTRVGKRSFTKKIAARLRLLVVDMKIYIYIYIYIYNIIFVYFLYIHPLGRGRYIP